LLPLMPFKPDSHWNIPWVNYGPEDDNSTNAAAALLWHQLINHPGWTEDVVLYSCYRQLYRSGKVLMTQSPFSAVLPCEGCGILRLLCSSRVFMFSKARWCFFPKMKHETHQTLQKQDISGSSLQL